jgi:hypothetical protein
MEEPFGKRMFALEEALGLVSPKKCGQLTAESTKTLLNATKFDAAELLDLEQIKVFLEMHLTEDEIAKKLCCHRTTVSRKIAKWMPTEDFREWLSSRWLSQYNRFSSDGDLQVEAFKQLTRLLCVSTTRKIEAKTESKNLTIIRMWTPNDATTGTGSNSEVLPVSEAKKLP